MRLVPLAAYDAQKSERFAVCGPKLMPSLRRNADNIEGTDRGDCVANENLTGTPYDHHEVAMVMSFKR